MIKPNKMLLHRLRRGVKQVAVLCLAGALVLTPGLKVEAVGAGSSIARGIDVSKHNLGIDWAFFLDIENNRNAKQGAILKSKITAGFIFPA